MSGVKGAVNRSAKTSGKNSNTNIATHTADTKDVVPNKNHDKDKLQVNFRVTNYDHNIISYVFQFFIL